MIQVSEEIYLKPLQKQNAEELFSLIEKNRDHLKKWLPWLDKSTELEDSIRFIKTSNTLLSQGKALILGVFKNENLVGMVSFNVIDLNSRKAAIGYWLSKDQKSQGIITTSVSALIQYGFSNMMLKKVTISCATENTPSISVAKRLGFSFLCIVKNKEWLYDHYVDHMIFEKDNPKK